MHGTMEVLRKESAVRPPNWVILITRHCAGFTRVVFKNLGAVLEL